MPVRKMRARRRVYRTKLPQTRGRTPPRRSRSARAVFWRGPPTLQGNRCRGRRAIFPAGSPFSARGRSRGRGVRPCRTSEDPPPTRAGCSAELCPPSNRNGQSGAGTPRCRPPQRERRGTAALNFCNTRPRSGRDACRERRPRCTRPACGAFWPPCSC